MLQRSRILPFRLVNTKKASDICKKTIFILYHLLGFYCSVYVHKLTISISIVNPALLLFIINFTLLLYCIIFPCYCARGYVFNVFVVFATGYRVVYVFCTHVSNKRETAAPKKRGCSFVNCKLLNLKQLIGLYTLFRSRMGGGLICMLCVHQ